MKTFVITPEISPTVEGPPQGKWTLADWEKLYDYPYEYEIIEGCIYGTLADRGIFHEWHNVRLYGLIADPAHEQGLARCFISNSVIMSGCDPVQPDFTVVLKEHEEIIKIVPDLWWRVYGVPDLIAEVLLSDKVDYDEGVKLEAYANAGVPEYAVIAPRERKLRLYSLEHPGKYADAHEFAGDDVVRFACLPSIEFRLSALFENAPDTTV